MEGWEREGGGTDRLEDTAEGGEKDPTVNTIGTDGKRSCPGSVGEQRRVTLEHPSNPEGALGAPSGSRSGGVGLTPLVRPEWSPATRHWTRLKQQESRVFRAAGAAGSPGPVGMGRHPVGCAALSGIPTRNSASTRNTLLKRIGSFTDSHPLSFFNCINNLIKGRIRIPLVQCLLP